MAQTFSVAEVSYGIVERREPKITEIKFDDGGYSLRMKKGFNSDLQVWDVPINAISIAGANTVEAFLAFHGGVDWFWWTPVRQTTPRKFICKRWTREPVSGSRTHDKLTMQFEEVVDIVG
jgi:phage-related protein